MSEPTNVEMMEDDIVFDPADFAEEDEGGNQTVENEPAEDHLGEETPSEPIEPTTEDPKPTEPAEQPLANQQELFELNYMGNVEKHTREEIITLAQMGRDRDRILQQRDNLQQYRSQNEPVLSDLARVSNLFGLEPTAFLSAMEKNLLRQQGKTDAEADAIIRAERVERQLNANTQAEQARQKQEAAARRQQADIDEFFRRYPGVDPRAIPQSVWDEVRSGGTLVNAYGRYSEIEKLKTENQRLQQELTAHKQNEENKQKSLGSMKSGSQFQKTDDFLAGFNEI